MPEIIDVNTMFGPMPTGMADLSVDHLHMMMSTHGLTACCTLSTVGLLLDHTAGNGATRAACAETADLLPLATLNPQSYFGDETVVGRLKSEGFKMVRFFPGAQGWPPDYAPFSQLVSRLAVEKLPIMIQADSVGSSTRIAEKYGNVGSSIVLSGVNDSMLAELVSVMRRFPMIGVETSELIAVGAIRQIVDCVGYDRIYFGSGAPRRPIAGLLGVIRSSGLSEPQLAAILGGNARQLIGP